MAAVFAGVHDLPIPGASFEVAQTVLILTRSASEANKLRLPFRVKCLPCWRFLKLRYSRPGGPTYPMPVASATGLRLSTTRGLTGRHTGHCVGPPGLACCVLLVPVAHATG